MNTLIQTEHPVRSVLRSTGVLVVALVAALLGQGPGWRRLLLLVLVAAWGGRLALGAGVGQHARAVRPGDGGRKIEHAQAGEHAVSARLRHPREA